MLSPIRSFTEDRVENVDGVCDDTGEHSDKASADSGERDDNSKPDLFWRGGVVGRLLQFFLLFVFFEWEFLESVLVLLSGDDLQASPLPPSPLLILLKPLLSPDEAGVLFDSERGKVFSNEGGFRYARAFLLRTA
jgi:hypothetical protein